jgi:N-methylhydantoinase A
VQDEAARISSPQAPRKGTRTVHFETTGIETPLYERDGLDIGATIEGPAIIEQFDATTVIPPGWSARVDGTRNLVIEKRR